ncbi:putative addiction module antidote protein [Caulobacter sp. D4A]|uniref:addiction module antidote protein n=1 Tax=unclassified Caulobacter TaxID=2648921 RepID=UPI000D72DCEB|nr:MULTISPECIES: addiction module antidote protein [unclassified Caulobacter]PXA89274.1 putative addiction module antidote protein [Caulobacter sp. D4A]PXA89892.1 putative addiction module antidote protein [Caulobacter sp. D5]
MSVETQPFDPAVYVETPEAAAAYLDEALATNDAAFIADALGVLARAKGMSGIAEAAGLGRQSLYKALATDGNPRFDTVLKVVGALGLRLSTVPASD